MNNAITYKNFKQIEYYSVASVGYDLFPFNFGQLNNLDYLLVNETGEFVFLDQGTLKLLISKSLDINSEIFNILLDKQFIYIKDNKFSIEQKAIKYRTKKQFLGTGPVLHLFVVTTRCQHKCHYCQITPQPEKSIEYDMSFDVARKSVDLMMNCPSQYITVEFQGGETLLAFDVVKEIVSYTNQLNVSKQKNIEFVLATSLVDITDDQLYFIKEHRINISTSLDGPEELHNLNRPIKSQNTYKKFKEGYAKVISILDEQPSPLLTVSKYSLSSIVSIVEEYIAFDCRTLSLRSLSPYGFATKTNNKIGYSVDEFIEFYLNSLDYIIELNKSGIYFQEGYATLLLKRILTPYSTGYVDLQSPSGAGINAMVYHYNGEIYPADEARMLAEMGDKNFLLGNVSNTSYDDLFESKKLETLINDSCAESLTECSECVYLQYCGCDPLFNYVKQNDHYGHRPTSDFCKKQKAIFSKIFNYIKEDNPTIMNIFWSWINKIPELNDNIKEKENCDTTTS